jgi:hypothetical protein
MSNAKDDNCCLPGDITVTQVHTGWMLGRAVEQIGPGPWWVYITIVTDFQEAVRRARDLARAANVRAWFHEAVDKFRPIPLDDSDYSL